MAGFMPGDRSLFGRLAMGSQPRVGGGDVQLPGEEGSDIMGLMRAMQQSQQAGLTRTATPFGSIMQNIMPIFAAAIYQKAAQQKQAQDQAALAQKSALTQSQIDLNKANALKAGAGGGPQNLQALLAQRLQAGQPIDDIVGAIQQTQKPANPTEWGSRLDAAGGDPAAAIAQKDAATAAHVQMMGQAAESLRQQKAAADELKRKNAPAEKANTYAFDPETGLRNSKASQADLDSGAALKLSGNDLKAWTNVRDAWRQLDALEAMVPDMLPKQGGPLATPITIGSELIGRGTGGKWKAFDQLASFLKFPILQATVRGRPPLAESRTIREVGATDSQDSAMDKINEFRQQLLGVADTLGFSPNAVLAPPAQPTKGTSPGLEVDIDKKTAGRMYMQLKGEHPDWGDSQLADEARKRLSASVGQ